jgi:hypothetical protein
MLFEVTNHGPSDTGTLVDIAKGVITMLAEKAANCAIGVVMIYVRLPASPVPISANSARVALAFQD